MREFHLQLKEAMSLRNVTQSELCLRTGIPKSAMSQYISGAFKPKQERTYLIAKALNVNEAWLMGYDDVGMEESQEVNSPTEEHNQTEEQILLLARKTKDLPEADRQKLVKLFESSINTFLEAQGKDD